MIDPLTLHPPRQISTLLTADRREGKRGKLGKKKIGKLRTGSTNTLLTAKGAECREGGAEKMKLEKVENRETKIRIGPLTSNL